MPINFSEHVIEQMKERNISEKVVREVTENPQEVLNSYRGRKLRRRYINDKLLEVVTVTEGSRITIITVYYLEE